MPKPTRVALGTMALLPVSILLRASARGVLAKTSATPLLILKSFDCSREALLNEHIPHLVIP